MGTEWAALSAETAAAIAAAKASGGRVVAVGTTVVRTLEAAAVADGTVKPMGGEVGLFITPGYRFRVVDALMTNFHLPRTTLLMLVSAFAGTDRLREAYREAVRLRYRMYSYGDAMLIL
jgi:S-adenosylmethionine:tRNA ribosyltransferase-isomerase